LNHTLAAQISLGPSPIQGTGKFQTAQASSLGTYISTIITTLTVVGGLAFVIFFFMAAFKWILSSGDKTMTEEAKSQMTNAVIGLIIMIVSYFIIGIVGGVLGLNILNPGQLLGITPASNIIPVPSTP
jgi:hypothetical protein